MKCENLKVGQIVFDQYGNEYEVLRLNDLPYYAEIKCTKLVKRAEVCRDWYVGGVSHAVHVINTEYFEEKCGLKTDESKYITIQSLKRKVEYILDEKHIEGRFDDIFDKVDKLEQYNSDENAFNVRQLLTGFKDDLLDVLKILKNDQ